MKIIRLTGSEPLSDIDFHPDSALLLPGRPLFYPDFGGDWHACLFLAIRINRLGKSVSEKFAPRYYDSFFARASLHSRRPFGHASRSPVGA